MEEKYITSEYGRVYYWINDIKSDYTLVFLPGLSASHDLFESQIEYFSKDYSVLVWDAPAHGKSRPYQNFSYDRAKDELKKIFDSEGILKVILIGQSAGGFVAQSFYRVYKDMVYGLLFIGSCPYLPEFYSASDRFWLRQTKWMFHLFPDGILRNSMAMMCSKTKKTKDNMLKMLDVYDYDELCNLLYIGFAGFLDECEKVEIECPVCLIVGKHDRTGKVMSYNRRWHKEKGYPLYIVEGAAHNANDDNPLTVNNIIKEFLENEVLA